MFIKNKKPFQVSVQLSGGKEYNRYFSTLTPAKTFYRKFKKGVNGKWLVYTPTEETILSDM